MDHDAGRLLDDAKVGWMACAGGLVYVAAGETNDTAGQPTVRALDARTGRRVWETDLGAAPQVPVVADGVVYTGAARSFSASSGTVVALDAATGRRLRRSADIGGPPFSLVVTGGVVVGTVILSPSLRSVSFGLDARTGRRLWQKAFPAGALAGTDGLAFCFTFVVGPSLSYTVQARHAPTGAVAWKRTFPGQTALAAARGVLYLGSGAIISSTAPGPDGPATTTSAYNGLNQVDCNGTPEASSSATCAQDAGPAPVAPGGVITPPSTAPPLGLTWTLFDTRGNELYSVTGVFPPGIGSASYLQTTYQLFNGNSVTLNGTNVTCAASAPSPSQPCATINADGVVTQLAYDSAGDLTSSATPDGNGTENATSSYAYDGDGEKTSVIAPDGNVSGANAGNYTTVTVYDADGRQKTVTRAGGTGATVTPRITEYGYDANGDQTTVKDPRGFTTTTTYNADGQATLVQDADGHYTLTCYDGDGNAAQTVPAAGVAASGLTPASCPTSYPPGYSDRLASDATVSTFDALGQQTRQTTPAPAGQSGYETTTYAYDGNGRTIQISAPPTGSSGTSQVTVSSYNNAGELMSETTGYGTSAASTTTYCYDPAGNKTAVVAPDGNTSGTASCQITQPWTVSSSLHPAQAAYQTTYSYDSANELVSSTAPATAADPSGATTTYTYDPAGNKLTATDPGQITTTWTYTPAGQVASASYSGSAAPAGQVRL